MNLFGRNMKYGCLVSLVIAYIAAVFVQTFKNWLKRNESTSKTNEELKDCIWVVTVAITNESYGVIASKSDNQSVVTYVARAEKQLAVGTAVRILSFDKMIAVVEEII